MLEKKPRRLGHDGANDGPSTPNGSSHPIGAEILVQGIDPITAE